MNNSRKPGFRVFSLAKMSLNVAADIASHKAKSLLFGGDDEVSKSRLNHKVGQELARTLSEMKGPLMKVGQIFAQVKDIVPPEISEALGQLRQYAKPVDIQVIREQIKQNLGDYPESLFEWFDETPYRAASLGQVHKAKLKTGEDVVVKVQYPDIQKDCSSDLKHLRHLFKVLPLLGVDSKSLDLVYLEIEEVIKRELDYVLEADTMKDFYEFFKDSDQVVIPFPYKALSGSSVITMSFEKGESLESFQKIRAQGRGEEALVTKISENLFFCLTEQIFKLRKIHVDPHAGNFALKPDGRIIIFDFGAVKELDEKVVGTFQKLVAAMLAYDIASIEKYLFKKGIRKEGSAELGADFYNPWLDILTKPFTQEEYSFEGCTIHSQAIQLAKGKWKENQAYFGPSRDTLLLDRLIVGHYWNLVHLKSNFSLKKQLSIYIS